MATSYDTFLGLANANTIRSTNTWEAHCTSGISDVDNVLKDAEVFIQGFTIPSRTVNYAEVSYKGYSAPLVPTNLEMQKEISFDVIEDINGSFRRAFLSWQNSVINADIEGGSVFEGDRGINEKSIIRLELFDKDNKTQSQIYKFYNVRIKSVGETALTYDAGDTAKFSVTMTCTYWTLEKANAGQLTDLK